MDAIECIKSRMSIRKFKPDPVLDDILVEIIESAKWSPSYKNSQPWEVAVVSGEKKESLSRMLAELIEKNEPPCPDIPEPESWPPAEKARIDSLMKMRSEQTGKDLNDPQVRKKAKLLNFNFYGAPHGVFLFQDASLPLWSLFDIGLFAQSLMLAAHAHGVGTVPQAFLTDYACHIKKFLDIPETKRLVLGISVGYPDWDSPANRFRTDRVHREEFFRILQ
ncbi:MAG: nitroreductase [Nitrospirota bacterium]